MSHAGHKPLCPAVWESSSALSTLHKSAVTHVSDSPQRDVVIIYLAKSACPTARNGDGASQRLNRRRARPHGLGPPHGGTA